MTSGPQLMQGNRGCALGAIAAGVRFFAGYPITPSTDIAEVFAEELPKVGGRFIQMEDEIASMGAILGASQAGVKVVTATSGPGFSLMQELIGYASMAEIPAVIVNVQRVGPSTGQPTAPAQGDVMQSRWGSHGDRGVIVLCPSSVSEAFSLMFTAVNMAETYRMPVIFLMDEVIGHLRESVFLAEGAEMEVAKRKVLSAGQLPFRAEGDGIAPMSIFGQGHCFHVTGLVHDEKGFPSTKPKRIAETIAHLHQKVEDHLERITKFTAVNCHRAAYIIIAYGATVRSAQAAVEDLESMGVSMGILQLQTLWPFPYDAVGRICGNADRVIFAEMNYGQLVGEAKKVLGEKVLGFNRYDGEMILPEELVQVVMDQIKVGDQ